MRQIFITKLYTGVGLIPQGSLRSYHDKGNARRTLFASIDSGANHQGSIMSRTDVAPVTTGGSILGFSI